MIYAGPPLPDPAADGLDLPGFVLADAERWGERPALIDGPSGRTLSYRELARAVRALARGLAARGYGPGHTLALTLENQPEFPVVLYGALAAGLRVALIDPHRPGEELLRQVRAAHTDLMVLVPGFDRPTATTPEAAWEELQVLGETESTLALAELMADVPGGSTPDDSGPVPPERGAVVAFTAGSAGPPRGVLLSHRNLTANARQMQARLPLSERDAIIAVTPWCGAFGLSAVLGPGLRAGATLVTAPALELCGYLELIARHRATRAYAPAALIRALVHARNVRVGGLGGSLKLLVSLAGPLPGELQQDCQDRLGCRVVQTYGMTELAPMALAEGLGGPGWPGRVGEPLPGTECRLIDPASGRDAAPGEPGELWVRGPQVMLGYLGDRAATRARIDRAGWLRTGDLAQLTPAGSFQLAGRLPDPLTAPARRPRVLGAALPGRPRLGALRRLAAGTRRSGQGLDPVGRRRRWL